MAMGKKEMTSVIVEKTGFTQKQAAQFIDAFTETVTEKLAANEKVQLIGFGTFLTRKSKARQGRNPGTGEPITIPEKTAAAFKPGKGLKDKVNGR